MSLTMPPLGCFLFRLPSQANESGPSLALSPFNPPSGTMPNLVSLHAQFHYGKKKSNPFFLSTSTLDELLDISLPPFLVVGSIHPSFL